MPGDCDRCHPVPMPGYPNYSRCGTCNVMVCWPTHVAYDQEGRMLARWPDSMPEREGGWPSPSVRPRQHHA